MITLLAKAQKSWIAKLILTLTALSFMSLFGITGYLASASNNRTVIRVDKIEISQAEFNYEFQKEFNAAKNLITDELSEEQNENLRSELSNAVAQRMLKEAIIDRTAQKYHISFSPFMIAQIIAHEPSFQDLSGHFNRDLFRRILSDTHISEEEYTHFVRRGLVEQILVRDPVKNIKTPDFLLNAELNADNKRRSFKYVLIDPENMPIDRTITEDEMKQYYEDFASSFIAPETRDLSVLYISVADIEAQTEITDDEIKAYYDEHIEEYETPEKRFVLQMMFPSMEEADAAYQKLQNGADFNEIAQNDAGQSNEDTTLGLVSENELVFEIAEDTFALQKGGYTKPIEVGEMFQITKVEKIEPSTKVDYNKAVAKIKAEIIAERSYDETYAFENRIEDMLGAGKTLEDISSELHLPILNVQGLAESGDTTQAPKSLESLVRSRDFIDTAFSYALGETSETIETDEGLALLRIDHVAESHSKEMSEVASEIKEMWLTNEKSAIAEETADDVMHDLENGDTLAQVSARYGLHLYKSQPITRNETFTNLLYDDIQELFMTALDEPYRTLTGEKHVIAVATEDYKNSAPIDESEKNLARLKVEQSLRQDLEKAMLDAYAKDYKIDIKYKLMGIID